MDRLFDVECRLLALLVQALEVVLPVEELVGYVLFAVI